VAIEWKWVEGINKDNDSEIHDQIASLFTFCYSLSPFVSSLIGSALYVEFGWVWATEITGVFVFVAAIFYLFFYSGFNIF